MSRISRYQDSISKFLKTKSCFSKSIKDNKTYEDIINTTDHILPIVALTILNSQYKKKNFKTHHGYFMASGIDVLATVINILDNRKYYDDTFGKSCIIDFLSEMPIYVFKCLSQNVEVLENLIEKEKALKIFHTALNHLQLAVPKIVKQTDFETNTKVKKTDIIKFNFDNKNIIKSKYKKLKQIDKDHLINYVDQKYGLVCQCAFVLGWLLGMGEEKMIPSLERIGTHLGLMLKISNDFTNLERDINTAETTTHNLIANYGIHTCFSLFMESKLKLIEGCLTLDIYTVTIKEISDHIEKKFDKCLKNTNIELNSVYSSFTDNTKSKPTNEGGDEEEEDENESDA
jgi:hypothetical protein